MTYDWNNMKLFYYQDPRGNFGDDLNVWLWPKLIPHLLDEDETERFVGIGTLLNQKLPTESKLHIFGSGVGYGQAPELSDRFIVHAVRGPQSAAALKLTADKAITDAAVLVRRFKPADTPKRRTIGLIPAGHSLDQHDWKATCDAADIAFISCHWDVDRVLKALTECELVLCEAMHGAIVADSLRIPWIPVSLYGETLDFKWNDWLATLGMRYAPHQLSALYDDSACSTSSKIKNRAKRLLQGMKLYGSGWSPPPPRPSTQREIEHVISELHRVARAKPWLSDEHLLDAHQERYERLLEGLKPTTTFGTPPF